MRGPSSVCGAYKSLGFRGLEFRGLGITGLGFRT